MGECSGNLVLLQSHVWFTFKGHLSFPSEATSLLGNESEQSYYSVLKGVWTCFRGTDNWYKLLSGSYFKYWWHNKVKPLLLVTVTNCFQNDSVPDRRQGYSDHGVRRLVIGQLWSLFASSSRSAVCWTGTLPELVHNSWCSCYDSCCESGCGLALSFYCYSNKSGITAEQWCSKPWWELVRAVITCGPPKIIVKLPLRTHQRKSSLWALETPRFLATLFLFMGYKFIWNVGYQIPIHPLMFIYWRV